MCDEKLKNGHTKGDTLKKVSSYLETAPYGGVAKNTFLNACAEIETYLPPRALLDEIHRIEAEGERIRNLRWDDRTLDIDIIFYGLTVPHTDYKNRTFVLGPLSEIAPDFICPVNGKKVSQLYAELIGNK